MSTWWPCSSGSVLFCLVRDDFLSWKSVGVVYYIYIFRSICSDLENKLSPVSRHRYGLFISPDGNWVEIMETLAFKVCFSLCWHSDSEQFTVNRQRVGVFKDTVADLFMSEFSPGMMKGTYDLLLRGRAHILYFLSELWIWRKIGARSEPAPHFWGRVICGHRQSFSEDSLSSWSTSFIFKNCQEVEMV